ncbi:hypothetical protein QNI16_15790 [Cytophagaceae bacterium YF14B1]|uniref:Uncharacterized protein n=1 Tax=Xanthocytophaga flava TaxID=3048013 RepID=A0AAE3QR91_9BACT|nr:hypothetical protein [Xanthocytophaga flavus]MDJ1481963.1 hypothetical protein [Xanthocytophaga flavus]
MKPHIFRSSSKWQLLYLSGLFCFYSCNSKQSSDAQIQTEHLDSAVVTRDTVFRDTATFIPGEAIKADTVPQVVVSAPDIAWEKKFTGKIQGFKSQAFEFALESESRVQIQVRNKKQAVFKLYRKTSDLNETVVKDDTHTWKGELEKGDYQLKVFLPLKLAAKKKSADFEVTVKVLK